MHTPGSGNDRRGIQLFDPGSTAAVDRTLEEVPRGSRLAASRRFTARSVPVIDPHSEQIAIVGDLHGEIGAATDIVERAHFHGARLLLQLGDFGGYWGGKIGAFERKLSRRLASRHMLMYFLAGNHDDWDHIPRLPRDRNGFGVLTDHLLWMPQGARVFIGGRTFGVLGGAYSVDQDGRTPHVDWWPDEQATAGDVDALGEAPLDVLLTHDAPMGVGLASTFDFADDHPANTTRWLVSQAVDRTGPSVLFHGHWHQRATHDFVRADREVTRVESIAADDDRASGDAVLLDLATLAVSPLPRRKQP